MPERLYCHCVLVLQTAASVSVMPLEFSFELDELYSLFIEAEHYGGLYFPALFLAYYTPDCNLERALPVPDYEPISQPPRS